MPATYMLPFPACCGAMQDPDAANIKKFIEIHSEKGLDFARAQYMSAFIFSDVGVEGMTEIYPGLWAYFCSDKANWEPPKPYTILPESPMPTIYNTITHKNDITPENTSISKEQKILKGKVRVLCNFYANHNYIGTKSRMVTELAKAPNDPWLAICAGSQHESTEALLLEQGFKIISRKVSPRTRNHLTLYLKAP